MPTFGNGTVVSPVNPLCQLFGHYPYLTSEDGHDPAGRPMMVNTKCVCLNCKAPLTIIVDDGNVFYGTSEQWRDCFFDNVSIGGIQEFADSNGWSVEFRQEIPPA